MLFHSRYVTQSYLVFRIRKLYYRNNAAILPVKSDWYKNKYFRKVIDLVT